MTKLLLKWFIHEDTCDPNNTKIRQKYGLLSGFVGVVCNLVLFIAKLLIGLLSGSIAVMADAFNNLSDIGSCVVTIAGFKLSAKPADKKHPFGYGRFEYISALIVSFFIILVGLEFLKSSIDKILHPSATQFAWVQLVILLLAIGVKLWMGFFNRTLGKIIDSEAMKAAAFDSISDVFVTFIALLSLLLSGFTSFPIDGILGTVVALFVLWGGFKIARDTISPLLGQAPDPTMVREIEEMIRSYEGIVGIHDLVVHNYGPGRIMASAHAEVPVSSDIVKIHEVIDRAEREIAHKFGIIIVIHLDPIITDDERVQAICEQVETIVREIDPVLSIHDFRMVDGKDQINLIFDVVMPHRFRLSSDELEEMIAQKLKTIDSRFEAVLTIDTSFIGED